ncbi:helix-turn-helix, type 11 [Vibrio nigripulchritudo ATCC 27043]|uniref:Transcriptional regulator n=1 Tax=Vibrio nigripulchritudo SOn1 TaxID=1238450 RepID=A0AAV2VNY6_9VIBR|nr:MULTISPECIES: YafY family protein [Vibrio]EGU61573.1 helix-turn-helix, type 11 [Vibrio nigripulchritudo ATCC 27043]KJY79516.1 transcriptional regulator [Vibrio nigripulchritudo]UAB73402.1 YafY family transcriptional regulator [Vibrio sp. SCSIO 43132]CCN71694.1 putative transcriptional regulator [Vibrio nigripulchritudo SFn118]CCO46384.1 putative transcriptional regulator [Vibrio nigripulchritudo SOn1]
MRRADRLIKIVHFLRSRRRAVTAKQIAEEFQICTRTVYRDIQDLVDSGAPISGEAGVGYIIDKKYYLPPVTFDSEELEALGLGISMVRQWTDDPFALKAINALEKIQAVLPADMQGEFQQITTYSMPSENMIPWTVSFSDIRESIRVRRKLEIEYVDDKKQASTRAIRPLALIFFSPVWLLASWCEKREDFRHFRLDRIQEMTLTEHFFEDDKDKNLDAYRAQDKRC